MQKQCTTLRRIINVIKKLKPLLGTRAPLRRVGCRQHAVCIICWASLRRDFVWPLPLQKDRVPAAICPEKTVMTT